MFYVNVVKVLSQRFEIYLLKPGIAHACNIHIFVSAVKIENCNRKKDTRICNILVKTLIVGYRRQNIHYENLPMQNTEIFSAEKKKNSNFTRKKKYIFLNFAQNIDGG